MKIGSKGERTAEENRSREAGYGGGGGGTRLVVVRVLGDFSREGRGGKQEEKSAGHSGGD